MLDDFKEKIKRRWQSREKNRNEVPKQKAAIFAIALILAFLIWLVVSLNRSYTVDVKVPLALGKISANRALTEELPKNVTVRVSGEGWNLLSIYKNPPRVFIEVSDEQINLFDQVRRQLQTASKLRVQSVDPLYLSLKLQEKVSKKVPVIARVETDFVSQYGYLQSPVLQPDSVVVSGAQAVIEDINHWVTDSLKLEKVDENFSVTVPLVEAGPLIALSAQQVQFTADVVQYTEGEVTVPVELKEAGVWENVIFSPKEVTITYLAPLKEFPSLNEKNIFAAYIPYSQLVEDTTGFISPKIVQLAKGLHVKVQQVQPRQVAYFNVIRTDN